MSGARRRKDLALVGAVAALAAAAFAVVRSGDMPPPAAADPYRPAPGAPVRIEYRAEGGLRALERAEVTVTGPGEGECTVRWRRRGAPEAEVARRALGEAAFGDLLALFARADFFEVDPVPRAGYVADMPSIAVALAVGDRAHEVTVNGRYYASRDLGPILRFFEQLVRSETPAGVSTGD